MADAEGEAAPVQEEVPQEEEEPVKEEVKVPPVFPLWHLSIDVQRRLRG
jgi:hypothetical protein